MNCKAAIAGAALAAGAYAGPAGPGWSETIKIASHVDGGCCLNSSGSDPEHDPGPTGKALSGVSVTVDDAGVDRLATSDHSEGDADSLALGASSGSDAMASGRGGEAGDNAPAAVGSIADPEPSTLTRLLIVLSDLRAQIFGGP
jgi:hypothetical protein